MYQSRPMKCLMCGETSFKKIEIIERDNCSSAGGWSRDTALQVKAEIEEFPKGNATPDRWGQDTNWNVESKVCLSCGNIVSFLPFDRLRRKKANEKAAAAKKAAETRKKKEAKKKADAAAKKAAIKAEKESLKKRLSELEDLD